MLSRQLARSRIIPFLRPLRPPNRLPPPPPQPRPFTQNTQLLILTPNTLRPQLPYLSQPSLRQTKGPARLISTETRAYLRDLSWQSGKWSAIIFIFFLLGAIAQSGIQMECEERKKPTPSEWRWLTRAHLRRAREEMLVIEEQRGPIIDWPKVGSHLKECLGRLEDPKYDGSGLVPAGGEEGDIAGVGKAGYEVSAKSYPWKEGYFEVLMNSAIAAEHLDTMVLDQRRGKVFPREVVVGLSNPDPRPTPVYMDSAPREEDCVSFYDPPEYYYMRILTTQGFGTRQKLEAAEGYANWLEFKGLNESAEEMYKWGIDIAKAALPTDAASSVHSVIDPQTHVLKTSDENNASAVTPNLLRATTALATHHARTGNTALALPIFLSVLRARREAPISPASFDPHTGPPGPSTDIGAAFAMVRGWLSSPAFPPEPPSGDTRLVRQSEKPGCDEGELMVYIGEILFASAGDAGRGKQQTEGVGWTRQGVLVAEANLRGKKDSEHQTNAMGGDRKCKECLITGVRNWETMLRRLSSQESSSGLREGSRDAGFLEWRGWFGGNGGMKGKTLDELAEGVLGEELRQVERLKERIVREGIEEDMRKGLPQGGLWFG